MSKKILIIDDSALMRRVISDIIKSGNEYEVAAIAKDGLEGYEYIRQNPTLYSAVILDINMPKMNGLQLLQKLQREHIEQTVIVVSTVAKEGTGNNSGIGIRGIRFRYKTGKLSGNEKRKL